MHKIKTLNKIAQIGLEVFGNRYTYGDDVENPDGIILRSASMHDMELPESLLAIARAGAGVNNIPIDKCSERGIVVFNTPGANANAVKELVLASLFLASRRIVQGIEWTKTLRGMGDKVPRLIEQGKSDFVGPELQGKTLGIIGLGAIGTMVANTARNLHMRVVGYDPFISVDSAWRISSRVTKAKDLKSLLSECDYISVHVPLTAETKGMFNSEAFAQVKKGVRLLNFSRGELVDTNDLLKAIEDGVVESYVTDFPTEEMLNVDKILAIPHLGASTPESEDNCAIAAAEELKDFLDNGNIKNSVNFPDCDMGRVMGKRVIAMHMNIPNVITKITNIFANKGINIENMVNKSKEDYAYTFLDVGCIPDGVIEKIKAIDGIIKVRVI